MKKISAVVLIVLFTVCAYAAADENRSLVSVNGNAEISAVPDEVIIRLSMDTKDKDLNEAKKMNDELSKKLVAIVTKNGVDKKDIKTDFIKIEPRYDKSYSEKGFAGYFVKKGMVIKLKDISKFEKLLSELVVSGADRVQSIEFGTSKLEELKDKARVAAVRKAKEKAKALAQELGQSIGKAVNIRENRVFAASAYKGMANTRLAMAESAGGGSEGAFEPGEISISADIYVEFELK